MNAIFWLITEVVNIFTILLFVYIVLGLLVQFGVVNPYNQVVRVVMDFLSRITEPLLQPIRNLLPNTGAIDFSPLVLIILLNIVLIVLGNVIYG